MKCFVEPAKEQLLKRTLLHWDGTIPLEYNYDYEPVRGVQCDPKAPACRHWKQNCNKKTYEGEDACCGNCYFSHEV